MLPTNWIITFWAPRCSGCKVQSPILNEISIEFSVELVKIDVEEIPELAEQFNITKVPTTIILKWWVEQVRFVWPQTKETIIRSLSDFAV